MRYQIHGYHSIRVMRWLRFARGMLRSGDSTLGPGLSQTIEEGRRAPGGGKEED